MKAHFVIPLCAIAAGCGWALGSWQPDGNARQVAADGNKIEAKGPERRSQPAAARLRIRRDFDGVTFAMKDSGSDKNELARGWATKDPHQFHAWLVHQIPPPDSQLAEAFFTDWVRSDPDAAFEAALALPSHFDDGYQSRLLTRMLSAALNADWRTGLAWAPRVQETGAGHMRLAVDFEWLEKPTLEMGEAIAKLPLGSAVETLLFRFSHQFAGSDFEAARRWALGVPAELSYYVMGSVLHQWASRDLPGALAYLETPATSATRQQLGKVVMSVYANRDPRGAVEWADKHMGVPGSSRTILQTWLYANMREATDYVVALEDPQRRNAHLRSLADSARRRNVPLLLDWVKPLAPEHRAVALLEVTSEVLRWRKNPGRQQFLDYLASLPESELSDDLIGEMRPGLSGRNPVESLKWAASLPGDRALFATETMVRAWAKINHGNAVQGIATMPAGPLRDAAERIVQEQGNAR